MVEVKEKELSGLVALCLKGVAEGVKSPILHFDPQQFHLIQHFYDVYPIAILFIKMITFARFS
jgi:hypothetical protein